MKAHLTESTSQDQNIYTASALLHQESLPGCQTPGKIITVGGAALAYIIIKLTEMTVFFSFTSIPLSSPQGRSTSANPACCLFSSNYPTQQKQRDKGKEYLCADPEDLLLPCQQDLSSRSPSTYAIPLLLHLLVLTSPFSSFCISVPS